MALVLALILFPFTVGAGLVCIRPDLLRRGIVGGATLAVCAGACYLALAKAPLEAAGAAYLDSARVGQGMLLVEVAMALYVIYVGIRARSFGVIWSFSFAAMRRKGAEVHC